MLISPKISRGNVWGKRERRAQIETTTRMDHGTGRSTYEKRAKRRNIRALHTAIREDNTEKLQELLDAGIEVDFQYGGESALQLAVILGLSPVCELLIKHGADVNKSNAEENSLLNMAAWRGYTEIVNLLVNNGADLNHTNVFSSTALNSAAYKGYHDIVEILATQEDCDINRQNKFGQTPLCVSAKQGHSQTVRTLLSVDADKNWFDNEKKTPLIVAIEKGHEDHIFMKDHEDVAKQLIDAGSNVDAQDRYGCTALWYAAKQGLSNIVKYLIEAKASLDLTDNKGNSPFMEAVKSLNIDVVKLLAASECDVNLKEHDKHQAALNMAVRMAAQVFGEKDQLQAMVRLLLSLGCDVNNSDLSGWTPLYHAAFGGELDIVMDLLNHGGLDLTVVTEWGETVLHAAAYGNKPEITDRLIKAGCNVNVVDRKKRLPLYTATCHKSKLGILEVLLAAGSKTDICESDEGLSPIFMAIQQHYTEAVNLLIQYNADVNTANKNGDTPLWVACEKGLSNIVEVLLKHPSIDVNKGVAHIPLHAATLHGFEHIVGMLLKKGCQVNKMTDICTTALYFAADADNVNLAKLLMFYGANPAAPYCVKLPCKCCKSYSDPHPHLELEPLQCAIRNNSFMMAMVILTGSPRMPYKVLNTLRDLMFRTSYAREAHLTQHMIVNFAKFFSRILQHPRSLKESCRGVIRELIGDRPFYKVTVLPLPAQLQEFLCLKDQALWKDYKVLD